MIQGGSTIVKGSDSGTLRIVAVDSNGNLIALFQGYDGSAYVPVLVDSSGKIIAVIQGSESVNVKQKATGELISEIQGSEGVAVKQKATGELISKIQGSQDVDVKQKATGELITEIVGSSGNAVAQDGSNRLLTTIVGSTGNPIAQDTNDALECVMKGNYGGVLKTWKVDSEGRGEMYIADLQDSYGNINEMGLGELANRIHSPPILYDKRGTILYFDDFEDIIHGKITTGGTATGTRSSDTAKTKGYSLKCASSSYPGLVYCKYFLTDFHTNKIGFAFSFSSANANQSLYCMIRYHDGTNEHRGDIKVDITANTIQYVNSSGVWTLLASNVYYYPDIYNWGTIKLVIDLNTLKYERAIVFGTEYDLSAQSLQSSGNLTNKRTEFTTLFSSSNATANSGYIDNIIITENEPAN